MSEKEFLELYTIRLDKMISTYKQEVLNSSSIGYIHLRNKIGELRGQITYKANLLISELLIEKGINPNQAAIQGSNVITLASKLLRMSFSIQRELFKDFDRFTEDILTDVNYKEHPNK